MKTKKHSYVKTEHTSPHFRLKHSCKHEKFIKFLFEGSIKNPPKNPRGRTKDTKLVLRYLEKNISASSRILLLRMRRRN